MTTELVKTVAKGDAFLDKERDGARYPVLLMVLSHRDSAQAGPATAL
jgi:hypothetical protein